MSPTLSLNRVLGFSQVERTDYFEKFARYFGHPSQKPYVIRVGSTVLFSDDTLDLRQQFDTLLDSSSRR